jgi:metallo-beta-lactamase family protein
MDISLSFLGAAQNVTGSRFLLEAGGHRFLVDCGMHQERDLRSRDWEPFPVPPESIDAVLISHAHLDHCGYFPRLASHGFKGPAYCSAATAEIMRISLLDSAHLQESDAEHKRRRHEREGRKGPHPEEPLYTVEQTKACFPQLKEIEQRKPVQLAEGVTATFYEAGHILGSSMIAVDLALNGEKRRIIFSGDVGRWDRPILKDPTVFKQADYVLVESTYGNRVHASVKDIENELERVIKTTMEAGGNLIVPSFAIERAQELLYYMKVLLGDKRIPRIPVFLDSPMAIAVTEVFRNHTHLFDKEAMQIMRESGSPFDFPTLMAVDSVDHSKSLNYLRGGAMIIAGSGMCTGGRVKHHLVNNISRPESTILFVGYQAVGTLGRQIVEGAERVRIFNEKYPVRARIEQIHGFSAHADQNELLRWLSSIENKPRKVFVVHGEEDSARDFAALVQKERHWDVAIPAYRETYPIN